MGPSGVGWLVGRSVDHNFLKGQEVTLPCSYWSTCINYAQILSLFSTIEAQQLELCETGPVALRVYEKKGETPEILSVSLFLLIWSKICKTEFTFMHDVQIFLVL